LTKTTRVQRLAAAIDAAIRHDEGYRAILYNKDHGFMRYHVTKGLHTVEQAGKRWRSKQLLLSVPEIDKLLESLAPPTQRILDILADAIGGHVVEVFTSGGGVIYLPDTSVHVRYHPIGGLSIVTQSLQRWVARDKILTSMELTPLFHKGPEGLKEIKHVTERAAERAVRAAAV